MGAKRIKIELQDASGKGVANVPVRASGCLELETSEGGFAFFLVDEPQVSILVKGAEVFSGALDAMPGVLVFKADGAGWSRVS